MWLIEIFFHFNQIFSCFCNHIYYFFLSSINVLILSKNIYHHHHHHQHHWVDLWVSYKQKCTFFHSNVDTWRIWIYPELCMMCGVGVRTFWRDLNKAKPTTTFKLSFWALNWCLPVDSLESYQSFTQVTHSIKFIYILSTKILLPPQMNTIHTYTLCKHPHDRKHHLTYRSDICIKFDEYEKMRLISAILNYLLYMRYLFISYNFSYFFVFFSYNLS